MEEIHEGGGGAANEKQRVGEVGATKPGAVACCENLQGRELVASARWEFA